MTLFGDQHRRFDGKCTGVSVLTVACQDGSIPLGQRLTLERKRTVRNPDSQQLEIECYVVVLSR